MEIHNGIYTKRGCQCEFCLLYDKYKWAVVMKCGCSCHTGDGMSGHDGLCCSIQNGLKRHNPYKDLEPLEVYQKELDRIEAEWNDDLNNISH